ncbi:MAG TPA: hypothetical protein VM619_06665 [Luteimonas sp.]|nr:hypothetical protein [Luteimonas sp.]
MKRSAASLVALSAIALSAIAAPALASEATATPEQCARITDVEVPYDVDIGADALHFSGRHRAIVVTADAIESNGRTFRDASVAGYQADLRDFLDDSGSMANAARSLLRNRGAVAQAAGDMCASILAVQRSGHAMEQRFPGFVSPVQITLR